MIKEHQEPLKHKAIDSFNEAKLKVTLPLKEDLDIMFQDFIFEINTSDFLVTFHCCEGHIVNNRKSIGANFSFFVNESGWNLFWLSVAPELSNILGAGMLNGGLRIITSIEDNPYNKISNQCIISIYIDYNSEEERIEKINKMQNIFKKYFLNK